MAVKVSVAQTPNVKRMREVPKACHEKNFGRHKHADKKAGSDELRRTDSDQNLKNKSLVSRSLSFHYERQDKYNKI